MSEAPQSSNHSALVLFGVGLLSIFFGLILLVERFTVASLVFGMDFPVTALDELRVSFIECGACFAIAQGVLLFAASFFLVSRNGASRGVIAGPASR